jgi:hypothetical protein
LDLIEILCDIGEVAVIAMPCVMHQNIDLILPTQLQSCLDKCHLPLIRNNISLHSDRFSTRAACRNLGCNFVGCDFALRGRVVNHNTGTALAELERYAGADTSLLILVVWEIYMILGCVYLDEPVTMAVLLSKSKPCRGGKIAVLLLPFI